MMKSATPSPLTSSTSMSRVESSSAPSTSPGTARSPAVSGAPPDRITRSGASALPITTSGKPSPSTSTISTSCVASFDVGVPSGVSANHVGLSPGGDLGPEAVV